MLAVRYLLAEFEGTRCTFNQPLLGWCECLLLARCGSEAHSGARLCGQNPLGAKLDPIFKADIWLGNVHQKCGSQSENHGTSFKPSGSSEEFLSWHKLAMSDCQRFIATHCEVNTALRSLGCPPSPTAATSICIETWT